MALKGLVSRLMSGARLQAGVAQVLRHPLPCPLLRHHGSPVVSWNIRSLTSNVELLERVNTEVKGQQDPSKTFCIVHIGGRQFKVTANDLIVVNRIQADVGDEIFLEKVLLAGSDDFTLVGTPLLSREVARVRAVVVEHNKMAKVVVFKKKRRKNYKRTKGHRQPISVLRISAVHLNTVT